MIVGSSAGIVHVLKVGCRWQDCPAVYGPSTTVYNRFRRWTMRGLWRRLFDALTRVDPGDVQAIDSTTAKAHRSAAGGKGGPRRRRSAARGAGAQRKSTPSRVVRIFPNAEACLRLVRALAVETTRTGSKLIATST
jgi:transposase